MISNFQFSHFSLFLNNCMFRTHQLTTTTVMTNLFKYLRFFFYIDQGMESTKINTGLASIAKTSIKLRNSRCNFFYGNMLRF
ncbi:hypothetical protein EVA_15125 [gut metagenome]|uniref:Uncharacterized protein n=1 Tax=gut metagenome TaxID=749906 RepID=J9G4M5_9ZZZZ